MPDRRRQLILLHGSRFDYTFAPETFTGKVVRRAAAAGNGGTPSHWQPCPACEGGSRRNRFGKLEPCSRCNATGRERVDDYTGETVVTAEAGDVKLADLIRRDTKTVQCPDCQNLAGEPTGVVHGRPCRRCQGTGQAAIPGSWLRPPVDPDRQGTQDALDVMLRSIEARNQWSYREYDRALASVSRHVNKPLRFAALTANAPEALRLLDDLYLPPATRSEDSLTAFEHALVELALTYLDSQMPDPILVPPDVVKNAKIIRNRRTLAKGRAVGAAARRQRDKEIRALARSGTGPQWIAAEYNLSVATVYEIVNRRSDAA